MSLLNDLLHKKVSLKDAGKMSTHTKQLAFIKEVFLNNLTYTWDQAVRAVPDIEERLVPISRNIAMGKKDRANPSPELKVMNSWFAHILACTQV